MLTWNLVQGTIGLDEACHNVSPTGQAVHHATHHTGWNANGKDCNHLVPGAAKHDLLGLEGDDGCQVSRNPAQCLDVAPHLAIYSHLSLA